MHGSVLFLTLATVALGATVRLNSEGTMASASALASKDRTNSATLAARDDLANIQVGRKPIAVDLSGKKPLISSDGSSIIDNTNLPLLGTNLPIISGPTLLLKKRKGSFLGLRRRDDANVIVQAVNEALDLTSDPSLLNGDMSAVPQNIVDNGRLTGLTTDNVGLTDLTTDADHLLDLENNDGRLTSLIPDSDHLLNLGNENAPLLALEDDHNPLLRVNLNLKRRTDLAAVAQVDLDPNHPKVTVDLKNLLGAANTGAPCAEGRAAETVNSDTVQDATADVVQPIVNDVVNNNIDATKIAASVDINGQAVVANNGDAVAAEAVNTQQPAATENGNGAATQQPAVTENGAGATAQQPAGTENGAGAATQQPAVTDNTNVAPAEVNTNQPIAIENPIDAPVNTNGPVSTATTNNLVDVTADANGQNIVHAAVNPGNENPVTVDVNTDRVPVADIGNADLIAGNVDLIGASGARDSLIDLDLENKEGRPLALKINPNSDSLLSTKVGDKEVLHVKRRLYQKRQLRLPGSALSADSDQVNLLTVDLSGDDEAKGVQILDTNVLDTNVLDTNVLDTNVLRPKGSILSRRNRDDDDEDDEDEDDDDEEQVKGSTVKDDKPKDAKDHPAADTNNDKKEASKNDPEKHKNSASSGSTSNKIALLGALVGTVFMLA
ncbi:hypothetical protein BGZ68_000418 [Mortierella alpina]|nr:hypothetical protein BGZ68_000418 [Mortierella alpina]